MLNFYSPLTLEMSQCLRRVNGRHMIIGVMLRSQTKVRRKCVSCHRCFDSPFLSGESRWEAVCPEVGLESPHTMARVP